MGTQTADSVGEKNSYFLAHFPISLYQFYKLDHSLECDGVFLHNLSRLWGGKEKNNRIKYTLLVNYFSVIYINLCNKNLLVKKRQNERKSLLRALHHPWLASQSRFLKFLLNKKIFKKWEKKYKLNTKWKFNGYTLIVYTFLHTFKAKQLFSKWKSTLETVWSHAQHMIERFIKINLQNMMSEEKQYLRS